MRVRVDYVSPLPPVRSGIADYSLDLLPGLAALADVRLIRLPGQPVDPAIERDWRMAPAEETGGDDEGARLPLYQMGNNRYHEGVLDLALRLPGVLTLHDVVLHHLLLDVTLGRGDYYSYRDRLTQDHGWVGRAAALAKRWNAYGDAPVFELLRPPLGAPAAARRAGPQRMGGRHDPRGRSGDPGAGGAHGHSAAAGRGRGSGPRACAAGSACPRTVRSWAPSDSRRRSSGRWWPSRRWPSRGSSRRIC